MQAALSSSLGIQDQLPRPASKADPHILLGPFPGRHLRNWNRRQGCACGFAFSSTLADLLAHLRHLRVPSHGTPSQRISSVLDPLVFWCHCFACPPSIWALLILTFGIAFLDSPEAFQELLLPLDGSREALLPNDARKHESTWFYAPAWRRVPTNRELWHDWKHADLCPRGHGRVHRLHVLVGRVQREAPLQTLTRYRATRGACTWEAARC